jgi:hypothetical protein
VLRKCNKHDEARDLLDQALALRRSVQGPDHPDAARLKSDVAVPDAMQRD